MSNAVTKKVSKEIEFEGVMMSKSRAFSLIFRRISKDESLDSKEIGKAVKIAVNAAFECTTACFGTYLANNRRVANGGDMYHHNKITNAKRRKRQQEIAQIAADVLAESVTSIVTEGPQEVVTEVVTNVVELNRWRVEDKDTKVLIDSFTSRSAAQEFNKSQEGNTRWFDGNKEVAQ
jgi:hypothetical protein